MTLLADDHLESTIGTTKHTKDTKMEGRGFVFKTLEATGLKLGFAANFGQDPKVEDERIVR